MKIDHENLWKLTCHDCISNPSHCGKNTFSEQKMLWVVANEFWVFQLQLCAVSSGRFGGLWAAPHTSKELCGQVFLQTGNSRFLVIKLTRIHLSLVCRLERIMLINMFACCHYRRIFRFNMVLCCVCRTSIYKF